MSTVRRLTEDDWERLSRVRLGALDDAPGAFAASIARERGFKESHWRMRLRSSDWWVATCPGGYRDDTTHQDVRDVGVVSAMIEPGAPLDQRHLVALWVAPGHRGRGVGSALVSAVVHHVAGQGLRAVTLWLLDGNAQAAALYRRHGFRPTGLTTPLARDPSRTEERWERTVDGTEAEGGEGHG